jgi:hypothetical protein
MAKTKQILDTYKSSKIAEKGANKQAVDFIKTKVGGAIAVNGFTPNALSGVSDYNTNDKVLEAARKGKINGTSYSQSVKR